MGFGEERYDLLGEFDEEPMKQDLGDVLYGRRKVGEKKLKTRYGAASSAEFCYVPFRHLSDFY